MRSKLYGIGSFVPGISIFTLVGIYFSKLLGDQAAVESSSETATMILLLFITFAAVILCWVYIITMMIHAAKHLTGNRRILWLILIYMLNLFIFPVYWFCFMRNTQSQ